MLKPVLLLFFVEHKISLTEWPALFYAKKGLSNSKCAPYDSGCILWINPLKPYDSSVWEMDWNLSLLKSCIESIAWQPSELTVIEWEKQLGLSAKNVFCIPQKKENLNFERHEGQ